MNQRLPYRGPFVRKAWLCVFALLTTSGCLGQNVENAETSEIFTDLVDQILTEAQAGEASDSQIDLLEQAKIEGKVPLELARSGAQAAVDCIVDAGVVSHYTEQRPSDGWVLPGYSVTYSGSISMDQADGIADACDAQESRWITMLYETQPLAKEVSDQYIRTREAPLRECLENHGYATDPQDDGLDLAKQALEVLEDSEHRVNCFAEANIDVYR